MKGNYFFPPNKKVYNISICKQVVSEDYHTEESTVT